MSHLEINGPEVDGLVAALLRASVMLSEAGHALLLQNAESEVGHGIVFEADCARSHAVTAALEP